MRLLFEKNLIHFLLVAPSASGFVLHPGSSAVSTRSGNEFLKHSDVLRSSTVEDQDAESKAAKKKKKNNNYIKRQRETIAKKKDFYRGAGVFKEVKEEVTKDMRVQFDSELMNAMKEDPNYMMEKDGVEFYLAKDHGFCWGGKYPMQLLACVLSCIMNLESNCSCCNVF